MTIDDEKIETWRVITWPRDVLPYWNQVNSAIEAIQVDGRYSLATVPEPDKDKWAIIVSSVPLTSKETQEMYDGWRETFYE